MDDERIAALPGMLEQITPEPWITHDASGASNDIGILADGGCIAECFSEIRRQNEGAFSQQKANAELIALAPTLAADLLAALDREAELRDALMDIRSHYTHDQNAFAGIVARLALGAKP